MQKKESVKCSYYGNSRCILDIDGCSGCCGRSRSNGNRQEKVYKKEGLTAKANPVCYRQNRKPVSVLTCHLSSRSTPRKRAGSPFVPRDSPVYMIFLVLVPSPPYVAMRRRELLPRGFTLTLFGRSVFCYGIHKITPICAFHSRMPFPVRTFLCLKFLVVISSSLLVSHSLKSLTINPKQRQIVLPIFIYIRACAPSCHFVRLSSLRLSSGSE